MGKELDSLLPIRQNGTKKRIITIPFTLMPHLQDAYMLLRWVNGKLDVWLITKRLEP
jgi:hypothetical protein